MRGCSSGSGGAGLLSLVWQKWRSKTAYETHAWMSIDSRPTMRFSEVYSDTRMCLGGRLQASGGSASQHRCRQGTTKDWESARAAKLYSTTRKGVMSRHGWMRTTWHTTHVTEKHHQVVPSPAPLCQPTTHEEVSYHFRLVALHRFPWSDPTPSINTLRMLTIEIGRSPHNNASGEPYFVSPASHLLAMSL